MLEPGALSCPSGIPWARGARRPRGEPLSCALLLGQGRRARRRGGSSRGLVAPGGQQRGSPHVPWKTLPRLLSRELKILQQILAEKGTRRFFCVFRFSQVAAPLADKGAAENTEAKLVTAGFVGGALIIIINFIY